jgi:hypothetical protein
LKKKTSKKHQVSGCTFEFILPCFKNLIETPSYIPSRERKKATDGTQDTDNVSAQSGEVKKEARNAFETVKEQGQTLLSESKQKVETVLSESQKTIQESVGKVKDSLDKRGYNAKMFIERTREGEETLRTFDVLYFGTNSSEEFESYNASCEWIPIVAASRINSGTFWARLATN